MPFMKGAPSANPLGRPRKNVPSGALARITELAARGVREKDIARSAASMSHETWINYKRDHPEVEEALETGRQKMHDALVGTLYAKAIKGDTVALLFLLKSRFGYREGVELGDARPQVVINLPAAVPLEQYRHAITVVPEAVSTDE